MRSRLVVFLVALVAVIALHMPLLSVPFFWDELGQYVPAARDIAWGGSWIPHSAQPNIHPPLVMAYLAGVWRLFGFSIAAARLAMLLWAAAGLMATFLLAIRLCRTLPGAPAFWPPVLLLIAPLFVTQSMMAQLDMPAMVLTTIVLLLFLEGRAASCLAVCMALVMVKETAAVVPVLFAIWLYREGEKRRALCFLLPLLPLAGWLLLLHGKTGYALGSQEFAEYNLFYTLHPVRLTMAVIRRVYTLFLADFHWAGTLSLVLAWKVLRRALAPIGREWRLVLAACAFEIAVVTMFGGATLERYLLPVLPVFYIAVAASWTVLAKLPRVALQAILVAGLITSNFWSSLFWPFPFEDNLAMVSMARLEASAASVIESNFPGHAVTTAWPMTDALRRPGLGYVETAQPVRRIRDFTAASIQKLERTNVDLMIIYSRDHEPRWNLLALGPLNSLHRRFYGYERPLPPEAIATRLRLRLVAGWQERGQWIRIYQGSGAPASTAFIVPGAGSGTPSPRNRDNTRRRTADCAPPASGRLATWKTSVNSMWVGVTPGSNNTTGAGSASTFAVWRASSRIMFIT